MASEHGSRPPSSKDSRHKKQQSFPPPADAQKAAKHPGPMASGSEHSKSTSSEHSKSTSGGQSLKSSTSSTHPSSSSTGAASEKSKPPPSFKAASANAPSASAPRHG